MLHFNGFFLRYFLALTRIYFCIAAQSFINESRISDEVLETHTDTNEQKLRERIISLTEIGKEVGNAKIYKSEKHQP